MIAPVIQTSLKMSSILYPLRLVLTLLLFGACSATVRADTENVIVRSIEWLVDNADNIMVVDNANDAKPKVVHVLKGDGNVSFPLQKFEPNSYRYFHASSGGTKRVIFVRETNKLLSEIDIGRIPNNQSSVTEAIFGFTQFGNPIMSESDLMQEVSKRLEIEQTIKIGIDENGLDQFETTGLYTYPPSTFILDTRDEYHILEIPSTADWRAHHCSLLQTSKFAPELARSLRELKRCRDSDTVIEKMLRQLLNRDGIAPGYIVHGPGKFAKSELFTQSDLMEIVSDSLNQFENGSASK